MCVNPDCDLFWCRECEKWGDCSNLGSVFHHEHKGLSEPWGITGRRVDKEEKKR